MAPMWAGQKSPWPIISPSASNTTHEKSRASLNIVEYDVRSMATPISSQMPMRLLRVTSSSTGSSTCRSATLRFGSVSRGM